MIDLLMRHPAVILQQIVILRSRRPHEFFRAGLTRNRQLALTLL